MKETEKIFGIFIDLIGKNNKKFVVFSIFLVICVLLFLNMIIGDFYGGIYAGTNIYEAYDITGYSEIVQMILVCILFILIGISCYYSFKAPKDGVNYKVNKILAISFIIFAIFPICSFKIIRANEENKAIEYQEQLVAKSQKKYSKYNKKVKELYAMLDINDDNSREIEIAEQINSEASKAEYNSSLLEAYFRDYQNDFWLLHRKVYSNNLKHDEILYYGTYFQISSISIIAALFYIFNFNEPMKKTKEIYENSL